MGMAAILVMWPGQFEQTFLTPPHGGSIWNLTLIGPVISEEMFKECGRRTTGELKGGDIIFSIISLWGKFRAQGQIIPKWIIPSGPNSNSFDLLCLSSLPASLTKIQSKVTEKSWRHLFFFSDIFFFFTAQGHLTPKWPVRYHRNSNSSEILCLSSIPLSLMKAEFIITEKRWWHHFPHSKSMWMLKGE